MKKILLLALLSATTLFTSCSNDDNSDSTSTQEELLIGTWKLKEFGYIKDNKDITTHDECEDQKSIIFTKDKSFINTIFEYDNSNCVSHDYLGKWSLKDITNLTLDYDDKDEFPNNDETTIKVLTKTDLRIEAASEEPEEKGTIFYSIYSRVN